MSQESYRIGLSMEIDELVFQGYIDSGVGRYVELHVPGRDELAHAPADWPTVLCKGSLNVRVPPEGFPEALRERSIAPAVSSLDLGFFAPAFEIEQAQFGNNRLTPTPAMPRRGAAQVWRAVLATGVHHIRCWVLRRFGAGVGDQLEILSDVHLRTEFGCADGQSAQVRLQGRWKV